MNTPKIKLEAGFFFGQKSAFNKWLKELTDSEQDLVIDMLVEFSQEQTEQIEAQNARLLEALKEAKTAIRTWHGMGMGKENEESIWKLYEQNSPEMKRINAAIAEAIAPTP